MDLHYYYNEKFNENFFYFINDKCSDFSKELLVNLSSNTNISWSIIENNINLPWDWEEISCNLNINVDILKNNLDKPWDWDNLSRYIIFENKENFKIFLDLAKNIDWDIISENESLTIDIINNNLDKPWEWASLALLTFSQNKNDEVLELFNNIKDEIVWENLCSTGRVSWEYISDNLDKYWIKNNCYLANNLSWEIIKNNQNINWYLESNTTEIIFISYNDNLPWEIINKNLHCFWDWDNLSFNKNITWDNIKNNLNKLWNWYGISCHPNITWDIIKNNLDMPWNWDAISLNENITWGIIKNNLNKPWNWDNVSGNKNITWDIIKNNLDMPWNWEEICINNHNITIDIIKNNLDMPWNYSLLCLNKSSLGKDLFIKNEIKNIALISLKKLNIFNDDIIQYILKFLK